MVTPIQIRNATQGTGLSRIDASKYISLLRSSGYQQSNRSQTAGNSRKSFSVLSCQTRRGEAGSSSLSYSRSRQQSSKSVQIAGPSRFPGSLGWKKQASTNYSTYRRRSYGTDAKLSVRVLGLESSADDSCAAIVGSDRKIWSNVVIKQHEVNAKWGGIHPREAQYTHAGNLPVAIRQALDESGLSIDDLDAIVFTRGPGMPGCLNVCGNAARALAAATGKPLIGVHHMQAHTLTPLLTESDPPTFPFLTLLVSGGHTQIVLAEAWDKFKILADSLDSKIGNAVDKVARFIRLPVSSDRGPGAMLEHYASLPPLPPYNTNPLPPLPIPMDKHTPQGKTLAFSFSGITTGVERLVDKLTGSQVSQTSGSGGLAIETGKDYHGRSVDIDEAGKREVCRVAQEAIMGHVVDKVRLALVSGPESIKGVRGLVLSGGVASNGLLRKRMREMLDYLNRDEIRLHCPPVSLCTDNAVMIAWTGILRMQNGATGDRFDLTTRPKWSLEDLYDDI